MEFAVSRTKVKKATVFASVKTLVIPFANPGDCWCATFGAALIRYVFCIFWESQRIKFREINPRRMRRRFLFFYRFMFFRGRRRNRRLFWGTFFGSQRQSRGRFGSDFFRGYCWNRFRFGDGIDWMGRLPVIGNLDELLLEVSSIGAVIFFRYAGIKRFFE